MAVETTTLRAFLNIAVVPILLGAAWYFAAGRPKDAASWLLVAFLTLLGARTLAGGLMDIVGASTPSGVAWNAVYFDLNLLAFTLFLWFAAFFLRPLAWRSPLGIVWGVVLAVETLFVLLWFVARFLLIAPDGHALPLYAWFAAPVAPYAILLVAWQARDLDARERRGAIMVVAAIMVATFNVAGGGLVNSARNGTLLAHLQDPVFDVGIVTSLFFALRWRIFFPLAIVAYGIVFTTLRIAIDYDFSNFALLVALRGIVPVHVAQRTRLFALDRPPRFVTRANAFVALASVFAMVNAIAIVLFDGEALAIAVGVFVGLTLGVLAALAVLPRGARSLFRFGRSDATSPAAGDPALVLGRYRFKRALGEGGQGRAQLHVDERLQREVVLKRVPGGEGAPAMREARALARVPHEHVVRVYDTDVHQGEGIVVMEHVGGGSLADLLARTGGKLAPREAKRIAESILAALAACHDAGIVHGDVKPENVLLTKDGAVKLADFGNARHAANITLMAGGGTLRYMAPEQFRGEAPDARTDLYATGVLLHEMLTGKWHLGEAPVEPAFTTVRALTGELVLALPPEAAGFARVLEKALARAPQDRYPTARAMLDDLRSVPT